MANGSSVPSNAALDGIQADRGHEDRQLRRGVRMAQTHTGHLAGSDAIIDAIFERHAVTRVRDLDELLETSALFAKLPADTGPRMAMYSISGGSGTLMAELAELHGVPLARLSEDDQAATADPHRRPPHRRQPDRQRRHVRAHPTT